MTQRPPLAQRLNSAVQFRAHRAWARFWMRFAGLHGFGRFAARLACWFTAPYFGRIHLAELSPAGFVAPSAVIAHPDLRVGQNVLIGDYVSIFQRDLGGPIELGDSVHVYGDTILQTGRAGKITVKSRTHIHPRCFLSAFMGPIDIGNDVEIAPGCAFYSHNHGIAPGELIRTQPLYTKGGIVIEDDVWLGYGVIVLDGVRIGRGAVVGAGSVVTTNVPAQAIACGNPVRVVKFRTE